MCASFSGEQLRCEISKLPKLVEFIGPYKQAVEFKNEFKEPLQEAPWLLVGGWWTANEANKLSDCGTLRTEESAGGASRQEH